LNTLSVSYADSSPKGGAYGVRNDDAAAGLAPHVREISSHNRMTDYDIQSWLALWESWRGAPEREK